MKENVNFVKRSLALLLCGGMFLGSTACGTDSAKTEGSDTSGTAGTEAAGASDAAGTDAAGTEADGADTAAADATALSVMQKFNTAQPDASQDNYRTWYEVFVYSFYDSDGEKNLITSTTAIRRQTRISVATVSG